MQDIAREITLLSTYQGSLVAFRRALFDACLAYRAMAGDRTPEPAERRLLQSDGVLRIAEFFLLMQRVVGTDPERVDAILNRHNADMKALRASCVAGFTPEGISADRLSRAILSERTRKAVLREIRGDRVVFEQSVLQRIFVRAMSFETTRLTLVELARGGQLARDEDRVVRYSPNGGLEELYLAHLGRVAACLDA